MQKSPEEILAEIEAQQAALDAELEKLGLPDLEDHDSAKQFAGYPPVIKAAYEASDKDLVAELTRLLDEGADADAASPWGETAVSQCFQRGAWEALRMLLARGADDAPLGLGEVGRGIVMGEVPEITEPMARDEAGRTPFLTACRVGNLAAARTYLPVTPDAGRIAEPDGEGPVWMAARSGSVEMLDWVLAQGFDVNARARFGGTALLQAVEQDNLAMAEALLTRGADLALGENISESNRARAANAPKSVFQKAASLIMAQTPFPMDMPDTISTPAFAAQSGDMARLLVAHGADISEFDDEMMPAALGTDRIAPVDVSPEAFNRHCTGRAGQANPEPYLPDFWREQIRTGRSGHVAEVEIMGKRAQFCGGTPVWSFQRFGRTATPLPDGRLVLVAGEHEDHYDPDFCIYADVTVLDGKGGVEHFIYPQDVFPPTDFHTATLVDDHILLIGSLGYQGQRAEGVTQVLRLDLGDFSIRPVETTGHNPGWINRHRAALDARTIIVNGGRIEPGYRENGDTFVLDLDTLVWRRAS